MSGQSTYVVMAYKVMVYIVMAYIVMARRVMAHVVMASEVWERAEYCSVSTSDGAYEADSVSSDICRGDIR